MTKCKANEDKQEWLNSLFNGVSQPRSRCAARGMKSTSRGECYFVHVVRRGTGGDPTPPVYTSPLLFSTLKTLLATRKSARPPRVQHASVSFRFRETSSATNLRRTLWLSLHKLYTRLERCFNLPDTFSSKQQQLHESKVFVCNVYVV